MLALCSSLAQLSWCAGPGDEHIPAGGHHHISVAKLGPRTSLVLHHCLAGVYASEYTLRALVMGQSSRLLCSAQHEEERGAMFHNVNLVAGMHQLWIWAMHQF